MEASVPLVQKAVTDDGPDNFKSMSEIEDEIGKKYKFFKQFDTVEDFSDHHYANKPVGKVKSYAYCFILYLLFDSILIVFFNFTPGRERVDKKNSA